MTAATRAIAAQLRTYVNDVDEAPALAIIESAAAIDALLDAIEAGGMVQPRPAPVMDLGPLRYVRQWHSAQSKNPNQSATMREFHEFNAKRLNIYFPQDDQA